MAQWPELQYCKTDLIASKGVVFCKFSQSSSALRALESIAENGMVRSIHLPAFFTCHVANSASPCTMYLVIQVRCGGW
jgi:hypothetical protein